MLEYEKVYVIYIYIFTNINDNRCLYKKKQHFAFGSVSWHVFFITFTDLLMVLNQKGEKKSNKTVFVIHFFQFINFSQYVPIVPTSCGLDSICVSG